MLNRSDAGYQGDLIGPASLLYPATSAARTAASFRVSVMAAPSREDSLTQFKKVG